MTEKDFCGIPGSGEWLSAEPIEKGWSSDRKYLVRTSSGEKLLLRLSGIGTLEEKRKEFGIVSLYAGSGIRMNLPLGFGVCAEGRSVYTLLTWLEGEDLEDVLPRLSEEEQYRLGTEAGYILKKIHSIPLAEEDVPKETKKPKKLRQLAAYEQSALRTPGDERALRFVRENLDCIWREPPAYLHGDFHPGNLIWSDGNIGVIDFNRWEVGDPYEEFYKLQSFGRELSVPYCIGQIDAYFGGEIPDGFWKALAVYSAHASLYSIKWAEKFGEEEIEGMKKRCASAFEDYEGFTLTVPKWYSGEYRRAFGSFPKAD